MNTLAPAIDYFVRETRILSAMSIACGTARDVFTAEGGDAVPETIFDLASLTKLFTGMLALRLREAGQLNFSAPITRYEPRLTELSGVSVEQVLSFQPGLVTPERVDTQPDAAHAREMLLRIRPSDAEDRRIYSDMHAMVIKLVLEGAAQESYMTLLRRHILAPLGMTHTFCRVPDDLRCLCLDYGGEHRIEREQYICREGPARGVPHDPKARVMNPDGDDCPGHAGLFATRGDMVRLCQGVLRGEVLSPESLRDMARNRTGRPLPEGGWTKFLGLQCFVKHPDQYYSEIPVYMGDAAFGCGGFTGCHLAIDPERGIFDLYLGNRVARRLTVLVPEKGRTLTDYGLLPDGLGEVTWPDGSKVISSANYVHQKDAHFHPWVARTLGLA